MTINKKGFTLTELLAVIVILGIVLSLVIVNVVKLKNDSQKEQYIADAKTFIADTKAKFKTIAYEEYVREAKQEDGISAQNLGYKFNSSIDYNLTETKIKIDKDATGDDYYLVKLCYNDTNNSIKCLGYSYDDTPQFLSELDLDSYKQDIAVDKELNNE